MRKSAKGEMLARAGVSKLKPLLPFTVEPPTQLPSPHLLLHPPPSLAKPQGHDLGLPPLASIRSALVRLASGVVEGRKLGRRASGVRDLPSPPSMEWDDTSPLLLDSAIGLAPLTSSLLELVLQALGLDSSPDSSPSRTSDRSPSKHEHLLRTLPPASSAQSPLLEAH